jgi:hypothetical protein
VIFFAITSSSTHDTDRGIMPPVEKKEDLS